MNEEHSQIGRHNPIPVPTPDMEAAVKAATAKPDGPSMDKTGSAGVGPHLEFDLDFTDQRGRAWQGRFKNEVLTVRKRLQVGLTKAALANGIPVDQLDTATSNLLEVLAHLSVSLTFSPDWFKNNRMDQYESEVLYAIYNEVAEHEARFRGAVTA